MLEVGGERGARAARGCTEAPEVERSVAGGRGPLCTRLLISGSPEAALWECCLALELWEQEELLGPEAVLTEGCEVE